MLSLWSYQVRNTSNVREKARHSDCFGLVVVAFTGATIDSFSPVRARRAPDLGTLLNDFHDTHFVHLLQRRNE